jgi:hypothetical protein
LGLDGVGGSISTTGAGGKVAVEASSVGISTVGVDVTGTIPYETQARETPRSSTSIRIFLDGIIVYILRSFE